MGWKVRQNFEQIEQHRILKPAEGYTPHIGMLIASLEYCRMKTKFNVAPLFPYQLDYLQDENSNSIGALLYHMVGVEVSIQELTFS